MAAMTNVTNNTTTSATASGATQSEALAQLNFDTFLKLLTVQLQNQDPMNPMDGTAFTEQIATFAGLEQQIATNKHLESLAMAETYGARTLATSYIGKEALVFNDKANLKNGQMEFSYSLDEPTAMTEIRVVDKFGLTVKTIEGSVKKGTHDFVWDGKDSGGDQLPDGEYKLFISAVDTDGNPIIASTYAYGRVNGVETNGDTITLNIGVNQKADFKTVLRVREAAQDDV